MKHRELTKIAMTTHPGLSEKWVQQLLADKPDLLGLGDLTVKDVERRQPHAGRLDMLLVDPDSGTRYEVEIQLGSTDESHIIRTIEYWDTERRRYPQYQHVAVIIAEDVTARFFNVISLFNGFIPIIAIQMSAFKIADDETTIVFTKVLDQVNLGTDEEDEGEPTDRKFWETKSSPAVLTLTDRVHSLIREDDPAAELKYNKFYIGLARNGVPSNYVELVPRRSRLNVSFKLPRTDEVSTLIEESGIDTLPYDPQWRHYRVIVRESDLEEHADLLRTLIGLARDSYFS